MKGNGVQMVRAKTPTIVDIAVAAGVSKSAVSRALRGDNEVSEENRKRIEEAAHRLGYVANAMARGLVSSRTHTIGVVLRDVKKPYYAYLQAGMQAQAERRDYRIVATTNAGELEIGDAIREIKNLISLQVDGLIIAPARLPSSAYIPYLQRTPIVIAGRRETHHGISSVACDETEGGFLLGRRLVELGHQHIAVIHVDESYSLRYSSRSTGMIEGIRLGGVTPVIWNSPSDLASAQVAGSRLAAAEVSAVMCPTDGAAMDVLDVLRQQGKTVANVSVTGFDGYGPLAAPYLGLTTFRQPIEEMGRAAIDLLIDQLDGGMVQDRFTLLRGKVVEGRTALKSPIRSPHTSSRRG